MTRNACRVALLFVVAIAVPVAAFVSYPRLPALGTVSLLPPLGKSLPPSPLPFRPLPIGPAIGHPPRITNVQFVDFDGDGRMDVIACDAQTNSVLWYRQTAAGRWGERVLGTDLLAPAHASVVDADGDGDRDVAVAVLGNIAPDDGVVGRVVLLDQQHDGSFQQRILLDDVRRVADVQPGDFDQDGDVDFAVAVFGYARGAVVWLENLGNGQWRDHRLHSAAGTIHVPVADYDGDGDLDIAAVVSQESEEVWCFENLGHGDFRPHRIFFTVNFDLGIAGLVKSDLDDDGDWDLVLPVGDDLEDEYAYPQPYHGCLWLENRGGWRFQIKRIARFGGTYAADCGDIDGDGDQDVALVSMVNAAGRSDHRGSLVWLENDGRQNFRCWKIADRPTQLVTVACGDIDGDGRSELATGRLNLMRPFEVAGRITLWTQGEGRK